MKDFLTLFIVLCLSVTNAYSDGPKVSDLVDDPYTSSSSSSQEMNYVKPPVIPQNCQVKKSSRMFTRSQSSLVNLFKNMSCDAASKDILGVTLNLDQCKMVNDCQREQGKITPITQEESKILHIDVMDFIIGENVRTEMEKYNSKESKNLKDLLAYADKMPDEFKKQINFCPGYNTAPVKCLNEAQFDSAAKSYIKTFYSQDEASSIKNNSSAALRSSDAMENFTRGLAAFEHQEPVEQSHFARWRMGLNQKFVALRSQSIAESVKKKNSSDTDFKNFIRLDKEWADKIKADSNSFEPGDDKLLDAIVSSVILEVDKVSPGELKERVKKAIHKFSIEEGSDLILSHGSKNISSFINKALDNIKFESNDFTSADRKVLSQKINGLRVKVANGILNEECAQRVVSLAQMCTKISNSMKAGKASNQSVKDAGIFRKMAESYKKMEPKSQSISAKISELERMGEAKNGVYNRFINLMFNTNSCKEKFPGVITNSSEEVLAVDDYIKAKENAAAEKTAIAYQNIVETVNKNEVLRREFSLSGYKFEGIKRDIPNVDVGPIALSKNETVAQSQAISENASSNLKSIVNETSPVINDGNNMMVQQPQIRNFDMVNNDSASTEDIKKNAESSYNERMLAERLKTLEKKESNLRKKMAGNTSEMQDVADNDELSALKKQIEDLKNEKLKASNSAVRDSSAGTTAEAKDTSEQARSGNAEARPISRAAVAEAESVDSGHTEAVQPRAQTNAGSADYSGDIPSAASAARSPASVAGGAASKNGADKTASGLTLTKTGEIVGDPGSILDNPNEGDIALFMERTHGEPFIIRENGELVKISPVLDAKGKPVLTSEGKIKFKKVKLSKAQQELIAKETNVNKAAKEVGVEPIRLFKLKSLLKEVRRN